MKILVVEEHVSMRHIIRHMLKQLGLADVDDAEGGAVALAKMKETRYDLVIVDAAIKPMSGYDLLKGIRVDPELEGLPVLMISPDAELDNVVKAKRAGVDGFIVKPFNLKTLETTIRGINGRQINRGEDRAAAATG